MKERLDWLDAARGIAILGVVTVHASTFMGKYWHLSLTLAPWVLMFFFFSSGICFSTKRSFFDQVVHQFRHLLLPYLVVGSMILVHIVKNGELTNYGRIEKIKIMAVSLMTSLSVGFDDVAIFHTRTLGIGGVYFLPWLFVAGLVYRLLHRVPFSGIVFLVLAYISTVTQRYVVFPFCIQNTFFSCLVIWAGHTFRNQVVSYVDWLDRQTLFKSLLLTSLLMVANAEACKFPFIIFPYYYLDYGGNATDLIIMPGIAVGTCMVISITVLLMKNRLLKDFLVFCGKENYVILILHTFDVIFIRDWSNCNELFWITTLLLYPAIAWCYRKGTDKLKILIQKSEAMS